MRNETLKNLLLTASLISASALLTACGDNPKKDSDTPAASDKPSDQSEAARKAAEEKAAALEAKIQGLEAQQTAAVAAAEKARQDEINALMAQQEMERSQLVEASQSKLKATVKEAAPTLQEALSQGLTEMDKEYESLLNESTNLLGKIKKESEDLLKPYILKQSPKNLNEFEAQAIQRKAHATSLAADVANLSEQSANDIAALNAKIEAAVSKYNSFVEDQGKAFGPALATLTLPALNEVVSNSIAQLPQYVRNLNLALEDAKLRRSADLRGLSYEENLRHAAATHLGDTLKNSAKWSDEIARKSGIERLSTFDTALNQFISEKTEALKSASISRDAFVDAFIANSNIAKSYTFRYWFDYTALNVMAPGLAKKVIDNLRQVIAGHEMVYIGAKSLPDWMSLFSGEAALSDQITMSLKKRLLQALRAMPNDYNSFFSDTASLYFETSTKNLTYGDAAQAASLSAGTLGDISGNISLRQARTSATGSADLRAFNVNGAAGESIALGMPLFVQLKGDVSSSKATEAATGSVAYRLGNTVIGAIQGYANSGDGFGIEGRQFETSVVASHSFGSFFIEGQLGSVSATDVHSSNWKGMRSQVTLGLDTEFVSPFVQLTHRQLDRSGLDLNQTTGFVGLDMDVAKLKADSYSVDARLTAKVGYGEKAWSVNATDLGTTTGVSSSVEWASSLNLNSGVKFTTNLGLDTVAGSSAAVNVSLDR